MAFLYFDTLNHHVRMCSIIYDGSCSGVMNHGSFLSPCLPERGPAPSTAHPSLKLDPWAWGCSGGLAVPTTSPARGGNADEREVLESPRPASRHIPTQQTNDRMATQFCRKTERPSARVSMAAGTKSQSACSALSPVTPRDGCARRKSPAAATHLACDRPAPPRGPEP